MRLSLFCLDLLFLFAYSESDSLLHSAIVWKVLYTPSCTKSPIMSKHNKNTISYMFSRSTHKSADILLERKCTETLQSNGSCVFVFVWNHSRSINPSAVQHWSCSYPPISVQAPAAWSCLNTELNAECCVLQVRKITVLPKGPVGVHLAVSLDTHTYTHGGNQPELVMNINEGGLVHSESTSGQQRHYTPMNDP